MYLGVVGGQAMCGYLDIVRLVRESGEAGGGLEGGCVPAPAAVAGATIALPGSYHHGHQ